MKGELVDPRTQPKPNQVDLPFVRHGTHSYQVRYAYYSKEFAGGRHGEEVRKEAWRTEEAWSTVPSATIWPLFI